MKRAIALLGSLAFAVSCAWVSPVTALELEDLQKQIEEVREKAGKSKRKIDQVRGKVSTGDEVDIGRKLMSGLLGAAPLVDSPALQQYVNDVGFWIAAQSRRDDLPWRFGVIDSDGVNAFAAPGGYIVITLGLFVLLENEAQLAGVLAHEISHVDRKHHLKALQKSMKREFWTDLTVDTVSDEDDRENLGELINAGVQLYATGLDRKYEYEADLRGVVLAARAGYDPYALLDVLTTIDSINPDADEMAVMLKTHPPTGDRLDKLAGKMDGRLDSFASGKVNAVRFQSLAVAP